MTESGIDISVVIVSYNSRLHLKLSLWAVRRASAGLNAEVFVVDNASPDGTAEWVRQNAEWVELIEMPENVGFSQANNAALSRCRGEVVLLLNPDTIIAQDTLSALVAHIRENPGTGAAGVHMTNGMGEFLKESKRGYPDMKTSFFKLTQLWRLYPKSAFLNAYYIGDKSEFCVCHAPILSGACMAFSHELLEKVGGFDPEFFMYSEDIDISWRMDKASGGGNTYRGDISILHFKGQSTLRQKRYIWHFYSSALLFAQKNEFPHHNWLVNQITKVGIWVAFSFSMARCVIMGAIERNRSFVVPRRIALVTDDPERVEHLAARFRPEIEEVEFHDYSSLAELSAKSFPAIVFDTETASFASALRYMENNVRKTAYGFLDTASDACLVFYNNNCHSLVRE